MKVIINICSANRAQMLKKCISSLNKQQAPENWEVNVVVIDNSRDSAYPYDYVQNLKENLKYPLYYFYEAEAGIPFARNRAVEESLKLGADWLIFIDDDETVQNNWLTSFIDATKKYDVDVIQGDIETDLPPNCPVWVTKRKSKVVLSGTELETASTGNVIFKASIVKDETLRFNTDMRFCGGSDTEFFLRAKDKGAKIIKINEALVIAELVKERITLSYNLYLGMRIGANASYISILRYGYLKSCKKFIYKAFKRIFVGLVKLSLSPIILVIYYKDKKYQRILYKSLRQVVSSIGILIGLTPYKMSPYKKIQGY